MVNLLNFNFHTKSLFWKSRNQLSTVLTFKLDYRSLRRGHQVVVLLKTDGSLKDERKELAPMNLPERGRCERTSVEEIRQPTKGQLEGNAHKVSLKAQASVCRVHPYVQNPDEHRIQRRTYCKWLRGELDTGPVPEKPDSRMTLGELGLKYQSVLGNTKCVLIDLSGTLHIGDRITEDAVDALAALRTLGSLAGLKIRFVTNTTKECKRLLLDRLRGLGFHIEDDELYTSLTVARRYCEQNDLRPMLLLDEKAKEDFVGINQHCLNAVLVGLSPNCFKYTEMNKPFRLLMSGAKLIGVHMGRYFQTEQGLALGPGPFIRMLEYASDEEAKIVGKPEPEFFKIAISSTNYSIEESVMIGDDVRDDVGGAMDIGIKGILVKTGKYRDYDERVLLPSAPDLVCKNFSVAVRCVIGAVLVKNHLPTGDEREVYRQGSRKLLHETGILSGPEFLEKMNAYANLCGFRPAMCPDKPKEKELEKLLDFAVFYSRDK